MNVNGQTKIYRKDFNGRPSYSRSIASQEYKDGQKGDWIRTYEPVQFPKGAEIPDRSIVQVQGFEAVYKNRKGEIQRKLVVQNYDVMDAPEDIPQGFETVEVEDLPF